MQLQGYYILHLGRRNVVNHLRRWKRHNRHGLLICVDCGFSWLKIGTAKISLDGEVECREKNDCMRRQLMRMRVKGKNL